MPLMGNEPSNILSARSRFLRDGRALKQEMILLLKLFVRRFILFNFCKLDNLIQSVKQIMNL